MVRGSAISFPPIITSLYESHTAPIGSDTFFRSFISCIRRRCVVVIPVKFLIVFLVSYPNDKVLFAFPTQRTVLMHGLKGC